MAEQLLADLILVRLLAKTSKPQRQSDVTKALWPFFSHRFSPGDWKNALSEAIQSLQNDGLTSEKSLALTEKGKDKALSYLGLSEVPPGLDWRKIKNQYLTGIAVGKPPTSSRKKEKSLDSDGLRALILSRHYDLPTEEQPTLMGTIDNVIKSKLHSSGKGRLTPNQMRTALLENVLDLDKGKDLEFWKKHLPAQAVGARRSGADELRLGLIRQWVDKEIKEGPGKDAQGETLARDEQFASLVLRAAKESPTGRFGDYKVFISHVWSRLQFQNALPGVEKTEFQDRLRAAHRAGLLTLSRADLVEAMNPTDVRESEISYLNTTFHFVRIDEEEPT